jgi:hypothetical protein
MSQFRGRIANFFQDFLSRPATALPKGAQWVVSFETIPIRAIKEGLKYEPQTWEVDEGLAITTAELLQKRQGCLFAQAINLPGEGYQANPEGLQMNGFLRTTVGAGRQAYSPIQMVFLESNVSFVDNVIRPWVIATSHLGLIARSGDLNYRTNLICSKLGILRPDEPPIVTQEYTFYGVCPVSVTSEELNYSTQTNPMFREADFIYHYYKLSTIGARYFKSAELPLPLSTPVYGRNENRAPIRRS